MDPLTALNTASAAITLLNMLIPQIQGMFDAGQITVEQQTKIQTEYAALKANLEAGTLFQGPEWQVRDPD